MNFRFHLGLAWALKSLSICLTFSCYFSSFTDSFTPVIKGQESHFSAKPLQTQTKRNKRQNKALEKEKRILYISKVSGFSCVVVQRNVHVGNAAIMGEEAFKIFRSNKKIQVANQKKSEQKLHKNPLTGLTLSREVRFSRKVSSSLVLNATTFSLLPGEDCPR